MSERLIALARRVYPNLGRRALVRESATPRTYERFTHRIGGAVGGLRLHLGNRNQYAVAHDIGVPGFFLVGDTTWPGLGTVACVLGSRHAAEHVLAHLRDGSVCDGQSVADASGSSKTANYLRNRERGKESAFFS